MMMRSYTASVGARLSCPKSGARRPRSETSGETSGVGLRVVNCPSYHRGWIADMFCQVSNNPPTTDLPMYPRSNAP